MSFQCFLTFIPTNILVVTVDTNCGVLWLQFCAVLEANILKVQGVVANCTITSVVLGSIRVSNTIAFTGSDPAAAEAARNSVATALSSSGTADYFGDSFGEVSVSNVATVTTFNPAGKLCVIWTTHIKPSCHACHHVASLTMH